MNISIHQDNGRKLEAQIPVVPIFCNGTWSIAVDLVEESGQKVTIFFQSPEQARDIGKMMAQAADALEAKLNPCAAQSCQLNSESIL